MNKSDIITHAKIRKIVTSKYFNVTAKTDITKASTTFYISREELPGKLFSGCKCDDEQINHICRILDSRHAMRKDHDEEL